MATEPLYRINARHAVRDVSGEHIILKPGNSGSATSTVVGLNDSSLYLWNKLLGREFSLNDVVQALTDEYEVDRATAEADAANWLDEIRSAGMLE